MRGSIHSWNMSSTLTAVPPPSNPTGIHNMTGGISDFDRTIIVSPTPSSNVGGIQPSWQMHSITVKKEVSDSTNEQAVHDSGISSAYTAGSDGFQTSSPDTSDHSHDSEHAIQHSSSSPKNGFCNSTPKQNVPLFNPPINGISSSYPQQNILNNLLTHGKSNDGNVTNQNGLISPTRTETPKSLDHSESGDSDYASNYYNKIDRDTFNHFLSMGQSENGSRDDSGDDEKSGDEDFEDYDENNLRAPRINSHGKVKIFKCKQCEFMADTKMDFWEHTKTHIKSDKMLTCPKCPFVTEYKHHLEYHLRNHFGSKPFKCIKCNYSCVNKSMLNSHLKSHSNIYQYRCADCAYATKYCHSLKLHLRKYKHNPAMVLNADGSPNPLPIIDVYGTRRGPKQKTMATFNPLKSPEDDFISKVTEKKNTPIEDYSNTFLNHQLPFPNFWKAFHNNINPLLFHNNNENEKPMPLQEQDKFDNVNDQSKFLQEISKNKYYNDFEKGKFPNEKDISISRDKFSLQNDLDKLTCDQCDYFTYNTKDIANHLESHRPPLIIPQMSPNNVTSNVVPPTEGALDLTSKDVTIIDSKIPPTPTTPTSKNRRKGRAYKLGHVALMQNTSDDDDCIDEREIKQIRLTDKIKIKEEKNIIEIDDKDEMMEKTSDKNETATKSDSKYNCMYCDIIFKDLCLYTMHMGYHGFKNPYTCNMCGEQNEDKVSFFLHIARMSHS